MNKKTRKIFTTLAAIILLIGLPAIYFIFNPKKALTFVFPDLDRISYINAVIKNDSAYAKVSAILQNKNPYKLSIDTLAFSLQLNDTILAQQTIRLHIRQSSFSEDTIQLPLNLNIKKIRRTIQKLQGTDSANLIADGFVIYETIFGRVKLNFHNKKRIAVPIPPKLKVIKVEKDHFELKDKVLFAEAWISIINEGKNLDLYLSEIEYDLSVKNTLHSSGKIPQSVNIKPGTSVIVKIPMQIKVLHPLNTLLKIKTNNDRLPYTLHITGYIRENISDNGFSSPAEIWASGTLELKK